jgi:hypothetical protein
VQPRTRLRIESLEDRSLPSVTLGDFVAIEPVGSLIYQATASSDIGGATVAREDFQSGALGGQWATFSSDPAGGRIQVTDPDLLYQVPPPGPPPALPPGVGPPPPSLFTAFGLLMDTANAGVDNLNEAVWTVDLTGNSRTSLQFAHANFNDELTPFYAGDFTGHFNADGIAISNDGVHWHPIFDAPRHTTDGNWESFNIDLTAEAAEAGMTLHDSTFFIKFQQFGDQPRNIDGRGWDNIRIVASTGETDSIPLTVDPGQSIQVIVSGDADLQVSARLLAGATVVASATAAARGGTAFLPLVHVPGPLAGHNPQPQTYRLAVSGADDTLGAYDVHVLLNTALEVEDTGGPGNDGPGAAQALPFAPLHSAGAASAGGKQPARAAVFGATDSSPVSGIVDEVEGNSPPLPAPPGPPPDLVGHAQNVDGAGWNLGDNPDVFEATALPHISIEGTGDDTVDYSFYDHSFDYYSFTVANAGDRAIFDVDDERLFAGKIVPFLDTMLFLYDTSGTLLAVNDDFYDFSSPTFTDPGSTYPQAALIQFTFDAPGTYVIGVAGFPSADTFGQILGTPLSAGQAYTLHISLENHALNPGGSDPVAEVEPNELQPQLVPDYLTLIAQNVDGAGWNLGDNPDVFEATALPHISIQGTGDGTFDYYSFTVANAGDSAIFDIDYDSSNPPPFLEPFLNTTIFLYDSSGTLLAANDDSFIDSSSPPFWDPGSNFGYASLLEFTFDAPGTYVIGVANVGSRDAFGQIGGYALLDGDAYTLHISLENHALNPGGSDPVAEVEPNDPPIPPPPDLGLFAQNLDDADWVLNTDTLVIVTKATTGPVYDPIVHDAGTFPHVSVRGTGDGTFDYYSFTVTDPGSQVFFSFTEDKTGILQAFLYDAHGSLVASQISGFSYIGHLDAGTYFVGVGTNGSVDLFGQLVGPAPPPGVEYTLTIVAEGHDAVPVAPDYYRLDLEAGESALVAAVDLSLATYLENGVFFTRSLGAVRVEVVDGGGAVLATGAATDNLDTVIAHFVAPATGTYYVRVTGTVAGLVYYATVLRDAGFDLEENDRIASAQPVLGADAAGRSWVLGSIDKEFLLDAADAGWWESTGFHHQLNQNYFAGFLPVTPEEGIFDALEYRNFFVFDLPALTSPLISAQLRLANPGIGNGPPGYVSSDPTETYTVFDVSTAIAELRATGSGRIDVFDDLGTGAAFGSQVVSREDNKLPYGLVTIDLNAAALADLRAHQGGPFAVGGALTTLAKGDALEGVFAASREGPRQLALTLADSDYYEISADGNARLRIETATPGGGAGAFGNDFDPLLRLYDSAGHLVASDDNGAADGRNAVLSYKVPKNGGGRYYVQVTSSTTSGQFTTGEYLLSIQGHRAGGKEGKDGKGEGKDGDGKGDGKGSGSKDGKGDSSGARTTRSANSTGLADPGVLLSPGSARGVAGGSPTTTPGHGQAHAHANRNAPAAALAARRGTSRPDAARVRSDGQDSLDAGAFEQSRQDGSLVYVNVAVVNGRTVAVLTFAGPDVVAGSLADGSYVLTVRADRVHDRWGRELDGDGDGSAGGDRVDGFVRLFGDADGDGDVDWLDRDRFRAAFGTSAVGHLWYFDLDGDGDVLGGRAGSSGKTCFS